VPLSVSEVRVPTLVSELLTTLLASVVPVSDPAAAAPPAGAQAGTPEVTVRTSLALPIASLLSVFEALAYSMSPVVQVLCAVPPLVAANVPVTPVLSGRPVQLVSVPLLGVPRTGVVSVGLVSVLFVRVSVPASVDSVPEVGSVTAVVAVAVNVVLNAPIVASVLLFASVSVALDAGAVIATLLTLVAVATPSVGVVSDGLVLRTTLPVQVAVVVPVPPARTGNVPAVSALALVE